MAEAATIAVVWPAVFSVIHLISGERPLVPEFEIGAIVAGIGLRLFDALRAYEHRADYAATTLK